jgi:hypothetical protein
MQTHQPIIADKELIRIWYEFYRLALSSSDSDIQKALKKSRRFYADWNGSATLHFDDWWREHRSLFIDEHIVRLSSTDEVRTNGNIYVTVPMGKSYAEILQEFKTLMNKELSAKMKVRKLPPTHRFAPTEIQGIKRDSLRMMLDLQKSVFFDESLKGISLRLKVLKFFSTDRYKKKRNLIPMSFSIDRSNINSDHQEEADRNIRRYRQKARKLLLNVASGVFPGKY